MPEQEVKYTIKIGKEGDGATNAAKDLGKVEEQAKKTGASLGDLKGKIELLFVGLAIEQALEEFAKTDRAIAKLNTSLTATGQFSREASTHLRELAAVLSEQTNIGGSDILNVMSKLISFGAKTQDVDRLAHSVLDLSTLLDKDLGRATLALGQGLQGDLGIFKSLGITVDETKSSVGQFNDALVELERRVGGQAAAAAKTLTGELDAARKAMSDMKETMGEWIAESISGLGKLIQKAGEFANNGPVQKANEQLLKQHDALRASLEREIDAMEKLGKVSQSTALTMKNNLALAFGEDPFAGDPTIGGPTPGIRRDAAREDDALNEIGRRIRPGIFNKGKAAATTAPGMVSTDGLLQKDLEAAIKFHDKMVELDEDIIQKNREAWDKNAELRDKQSLEQMNAALQVNATERELNDELTLSKLKGIDKERAQMEINHQRRQQQIRELTYDDEERYAELIKLENDLTAVETARFEHAKSAAGQFETDLKGIAERAQELFSGGLAGAIVDSFEQGGKAFQKFAADFFKTMAKMILQAVILRALRGLIGGAAGGGEGGFSSVGANAATGGQFRALAGGGMAETNGPVTMPRFGVLAGEAGRELLTVMAQPRSVNFNGLSARVGNVGGRAMAITDANDLSRAGGGAGGMIVIQLSHSPETEARIVRNSVRGAQVQITQDLGQDTPVSRGVKRVAT